MARIANDPNLEAEPDFLGPAFEPLRQLMIAAEPGLTPEQAAERLLVPWRADHENRVQRWQEQLEADRREEEQRAQGELGQRPEQPGEQEPVDAEERRDEEKKPKVVKWDENSQVGNSIIDRPSQYAIHRLKSFEYVPLWYFCPEGCRDAMEDATSMGSEALGLTKTSNGLAFLPAMAGCPSRRALQDHELTWSQFDLAYTSFITHIQTYKWPEHYIEALINFFGNIVVHLLHREDHGPKILLLYASQV